MPSKLNMKYLFWCWSKYVGWSGCGDSHELQIDRLCVKLDSFGFTGLHVEAQGIGSTILPIMPQCYEWKKEFCGWNIWCSSRVSLTKSPVLVGDFNVLVDTDTDKWKGIIGKHGVTELNQKWRYLLQLSDTTDAAWFKPFSSAESFTNIYMLSN